jgi:hypothetical protein
LPDVFPDVFFCVFLDIRLPFVAFGGSINGKPAGLILSARIEPTAGQI